MNKRIIGMLLMLTQILALSFVILAYRVFPVTATKALTVTTNKMHYAPGESVIISATNTGDETINLRHSPGIEILNSADVIVWPSIVLWVLVPVSPGQTKTWTWDQKDGYTGQQVPDGLYRVEAKCVELDPDPSAYFYIASDKSYKWDNPVITWQGTGEDFNWAGWGGYWFRHGTEGIAFTFTGIDKTLLVSEWVDIEFHLEITNCMNGDAGLDGLLDIIINPGIPVYNYTINNVLFDNLDTTNLVYATGTGGTYETETHVTVNKNYIVNGTITIKVERHVDDSNINNHASPGTLAPIDLGTQDTSTPIVPSNVYENDDPYTVHIGVRTTDSTGEFAADGEVVMRPEWLAPYPLMTDMNKDGIVNIVDVAIVALDFGKALPPDP